MASTDHTPRLFVLAGTNGAGKSSVGGATIRARGAQYFNPDEAAASIRRAQPHLSATQANSAAWHEGKRLLQHAIALGLDYNFETTLGGKSFAKLLEEAASKGFEVRVWYVGLASAEHHLARVKARVRKGGHDIPEADIRRRFDQSRLQLIQLLPVLTELRVYDNTAEADPHKGIAPKPQLLLHWQRDKAGRGAVRHPQDAAALADTPEWAKPVVMAAMKASLQAASPEPQTGPKAKAAMPPAAGPVADLKPAAKAERPRRPAPVSLKTVAPSPAGAPPKRNRPAK